MNFVTDIEGKTELAVIFTDARILPVALTANGRVLISEEILYIWPSNPDEIKKLDIGVVEEMQRGEIPLLRQLKSLL